MDSIINAITDFFRNILWGIAEVFLFILDFLWKCVLKIATLDIGSLAFLKQWFLLISVALSMFIIFRIVKMTVKNWVDEEYQEKFKPLRVVTMTVAASLVISLMPISYSYVCSITSDAIENVSVFIPGSVSEKEMQMSDILIQSGRLNTKDIDADLGSKIKMNDSFDINKRDDNDEYLYFSSFASLFLIILVSIVSVFIFFTTALQIAQRFYNIIIKYMISPYAVSGLVDPEDQSFSIWIKMVAGDLLMNFFQIYSIYLVMFLCNNNIIQKMLGSGGLGLCCQILFFLGGISAVQNIPTTIARLIGGSGAGSMQAIQDIKTATTFGKALTLGAAGTIAGGLMGGIGGAMQGQAMTNENDSIATGFKNVAKGTIKGASEPIKQTFAGGRIGGGVTSGMNILKAGQSQLFGKGANSGTGTNIKGSSVTPGKSIKPMSSVTSGTSTAAKGNIFNASTPMDAQHSALADKMGSAYYDSPSEAQLSLAEDLGVQNADKMTKGELSLALDDAGASPSYFRDYSSEHPDTVSGDYSRQEGATDSISGYGDTSSIEEGEFKDVSSYDSSGYESSSVSFGDSSVSAKKYSSPEKATQEQIILAENFGIKGADKMNRKQLSKALEKAGATEYSMFNPATTTKKKTNISQGGSLFYNQTLLARKKGIKK